MRIGTFFACLVALGWASPVAAQVAFPNVPNPMTPTGPGFYFSLLKLIPSVLLFLLWVRCCDWINRDSQELRLNHRKWNQIAVFSYLATLLLTWLMPSPLAFWIGFPLQLAAVLGSVFTYGAHRNSKLFDDEKVFTALHTKRWLSKTLKPLGIKIKVPEPKGPGLALTFIPKGGANEQANQGNLLAAKHSPGFEVAKEVVIDMLERGASAVMLDFTQENVTAKYQLDGVWHNGQPRDRQSGDLALAALKTIAALKKDERRAKQAGELGVEWRKTKHNVKIVSQGTKTGERVVLQIDEGARKPKRLNELGMRDKTFEQIQELLGPEAKYGLVIISTLPGGGLSNAVAATVAGMDRFVRTVVGIEDTNRREPQVDNVTVTTYDSTKGETSQTYLEKLIREYPDAIVVPDLNDSDTARRLIEQAKEGPEGRLVVVGVRAKDSVDAVLRLAMHKIPPAELAQVGILSLHERLIRKLCDSCKQPYEPSAQVLQQLGIPPGKVEALYNVGQPPPDKPNLICKDCQGLGYRGRTGLFELLRFNDVIRQILSTEPKVDVIKKAARKGGMRTMQEEGIALVATGGTSVQELSRVLKEA